MVFNLNDKQKDIIKCFEDNGLCFVNASAGTGKTSTITEIYIKLLENREKVSNIVVITFTKAAANEMLFRIRSKVRNKIDNIKNTNDEKSLKEKKYWQNVYKDILTSAKISTINAFANSIAMENAMYLSCSYRVSSHFGYTSLKHVKYQSLCTKNTFISVPGSLHINRRNLCP